MCSSFQPDSWSSTSAATRSPEIQRVKKSTPTARTSGSAKRSSISGLSALVAIARAAATIVAVAPTLVAKSQVSLSVHGMRLGPPRSHRLLSPYNDWWAHGVPCPTRAHHRAAIDPSPCRIGELECRCPPVPSVEHQLEDRDEPIGALL